MQTFVSCRITELWFGLYDIFPFFITLNLKQHEGRHLISKLGLLNFALYPSGCVFQFVLKYWSNRWKNSMRSSRSPIPIKFDIDYYNCHKILFIKLNLAMLPRRKVILFSIPLREVHITFSFSLFVLNILLILLYCFDYNAYDI